MQYDFISLPCDVEGNPEPWIQWAKDGQLIALNDPNRYQTSLGTLEIAQVQHTDSGIYECHAMNIVGNDTQVYTLVINGKLSPEFMFIKGFDGLCVYGYSKNNELINLILRLIEEHAKQYT